jgi:uncharacterized protein with GYD domain
VAGVRGVGGARGATLAKLHDAELVVATYITLARYTREGITGLKERWGQGSPQERAKQGARALGCEIKATYMTMGQYDLVAIVEAPNDEAMTKLALMTGMQGVFQTETLRAYDEAEAAKLVQSLR